MVDVELKQGEEQKEFEGTIEAVKDKYNNFSIQGITVSEGAKKGEPHTFSLRDFPDMHKATISDFSEGDFVKLVGGYKPTRKGVRVLEVQKHKRNAQIQERTPSEEASEVDVSYPVERIEYEEEVPEKDDNVPPFVHIIGSVEQISKAFKKFSAIKREILTEEDYLYIDEQGKWHTSRPNKKVSEYIKKTGWQKLAVAFSLSTKLIYKEKTWSKDNRGRPYYVWCYTYKISHPSGKFITTEGCCSSKDSFFTKGGYAEPDEADIQHKAQTVAINRGISALIGGGPSAEEMQKEV